MTTRKIDYITLIAGPDNRILARCKIRNYPKSRDFVISA